MKKINKLLLKIFATTFFQPFYEKLHYLSLKGMNYGSANSPVDSGELSVISLLKKELPKNAVIFDVGANNGQYLSYLLDMLKDISPVIHSFEPDVKAFKDLSDNYSSNNNVVLNNFALGEKETNSLIYISRKGGVDSSLIDSQKKGLDSYEINVKTLDSYCEANKIVKIHFLKIDTEGYEMSVLKGSQQLITSKRIERIQLEHGSIHSIIVGSSLYNYLRILKNYTLYHIKQNGIYKLKYSPKNEIYYNSNYYFKLDD